MTLLNFWKNKGEKSKGCCSNASCNQDTMTDAINKQSQGTKVKILGSGCAKCNELEHNIVEALRQLGQSTKVDHVTDFSEIASYGVMTTPAVVVDGKVISYGKVLKVDEAINLLEKSM